MVAGTGKRGNWITGGKVTIRSQVIEASGSHGKEITLRYFADRLIKYELPPSKLGVVGDTGIEPVASSV